MRKAESGGMGKKDLEGALDGRQKDTIVMGIYERAIS